MDYMLIVVVKVSQVKNRFNSPGSDIQEMVEEGAVNDEDCGAWKYGTVG